MTDKPFPKTYLGDGVYASFDGYQIWLEGNADNRQNLIALEPQVFGSLMAYWGTIVELFAEEAKKAEEAKG